MQLQESDFDERSLSLCESTETSERMCGDFFNTVKKGPGKVIVTAIEPPPEFQVGLKIIDPFFFLKLRKFILVVESIFLLCEVLI